MKKVHRYMCVFQTHNFYILIKEIIARKERSNYGTYKSHEFFNIPMQLPKAPKFIVGLDAGYSGMKVQDILFIKQVQAFICQFFYK